MPRKKKEATETATRSKKKVGREAWAEKHGKHRIDLDALRKTVVYSTGSIKLDGITGGLLGSHYSQLWGPMRSGKTTFALKAAARVINDGGNVLWFDEERALVLNEDRNKDWLVRNGLDPDSPQLDIMECLPGEDVFQIMEDSVLSRSHQLIVVDSIAAMGVTRSLNGDYGDANFGATAAFLSQAFPKLNSSFGKGKNRETHIMFLNQARSNIGSPHGGNKPFGGKAMEHYPSYTLRFQRTGGKVETTGEVITTLKVKFEKNRAAACPADVPLTISSDFGVDTVQEIIDFGIFSGRIQKNDAMYTAFSATTGEELFKVRGLSAFKKSVAEANLVQEWYNDALKSATDNPGAW